MSELPYIPAPGRFLKLPYDLLNDPQYRDIPPGGKILYAHMANRVPLSQSNNRYDDQGNCYIFLSVHEAQRILGCGHDQVTKLMRILEKHHLIKRTAQGQGKPHRIVVFPCSAAAKTAEIPPSGQTVSSNLDSGNSAESKTNPDRPIDTFSIMAMIKKCCVDSTLDDLTPDTLDKVIRVLADTVCYPKDTITIGQHTVKYDSICSRIWALDPIHMRNLYYFWLCDCKTAPEPRDRLLQYLIDSPIR